jgi:hypothetical protein
VVMPNLVRRGRPPLVNTLKKKESFHAKVEENKIIIPFQKLLIRNGNTHLLFVLPHNTSIFRK